MAKILVDTSVWIDFFRGTLSSVGHAFLSEAIAYRTAVLSDIIRHEILVGAQDQSHHHELQQLFSPLECFRIADHQLEAFDAFAWKLQKKGFKGKCTDAAIAFVAHCHHLSLLTFDRYFGCVQKLGLIELVEIESVSP